MIRGRKPKTPTEEPIPVFTRVLPKARRGDPDYDPLRPDRRKPWCCPLDDKEEKEDMATCRAIMEKSFGPGAGRFRILVKTIPKQ